MTNRGAPNPGVLDSAGGASTAATRVFVETAARLHFGVLDLRGALGRWFGGIGAAAPAPTLLVSAAAADEVHAEGEHADRAAQFARRILEHYEVRGGAHVRIHRTLPSHKGLGSGTQLALAVGRAIAELYRLPAEAASLSSAVGRARRSAIGTWAFEHGGFVLEGGRRGGSDEPAPLLAHHPFPASWRCVVAVPRAAPGVSGDAEREAFAALPTPPREDAERIAHLVLMSLLPSLMEDDIAAFGAALTEIQCINGRWFAPAQHGVFAPGPSTALVQLMRDAGAPGVGQSSWGPAVYAIVDGDAAAQPLADLVREAMGPGEVYAGPFASHGARILTSL